MCETCSLPIAPLRAPNRQPPLRLQSQRAARDGDELTVDRNRHNATEYNRAQRKLVPARAREATAFRFPSLGMDCTQVAAECTGRLELPSPSRHANRPNGTKISTRLTSPNAADIVISTGRYSNIESTPQGRQASETAQLLPRNPV